MALAAPNPSNQNPRVRSYLDRLDIQLPFLDTALPKFASATRSQSLHFSGSRSSWDTPAPTPPALEPSRSNPSISCDDIDADANSINHDDEGSWKNLDNIAALGLTLENVEDRMQLAPPEVHITPSDDAPETEQSAVESQNMTSPFHKWVKSLHKRAHRPQPMEGQQLEAPFPEYAARKAFVGGSGHRKSFSGSSMGLVTAVKSASVSLAGTSVVGRSRRHTARSSTYARTERSSRASMSGPRFSEDSTCFEPSPVEDPAVTERLLQRRRILEELISTEESYIGDIRFLMNVYVTILASLPTPHAGLRSSINRNLTDVIELHEEILGELHRLVPNSEYAQTEGPPLSRHVNGKGHGRWHSLDSVPKNDGGMSWPQNMSKMVAEPNVAAEVAHVFGKRMHRFFIYEEYGAKYELMIKDVATAHRTLPQWEMYQKGLEALAASLGSAHQHLDYARKSLTIGDLLVKPIQRICRYPLLFGELLKFTPVCDCPNSHMEVEDVLIRLREATAEINKATDDPGVKARMEKTWLLQDRLALPGQKLDAASKSTIRSFGQIQLCGALHVCWQTRDSANGQYMVALLYKDYLVLASAAKVEPVYTIQVCVSLDSIRLEEVDNGRGLQCHTAPFSWKLVFECDHQLYEIIMSGCSAKEEVEWRSRLAHQDSSDPLEMSESAVHSSISLNIKSLGTVFGKPGTVARRVSIHRATTVGPKSPLCQVIIKNTSSMKDIPPPGTSPSINRSQSLLTTNTRIPILTPSRNERARLEASLADVWSRKVLPFPGMGSRTRSEHLVRSGTSAMMRKLSVASITNSLSKRSSGNLGGAARCYDEDALPEINVDALIEPDSDMMGLASANGPVAKEKPPLPVIHDEPTRGNSSHSSLVAGDFITLAGTVRKLDPSKLDPDWRADNDGLSTPALRSTSSNSSLAPRNPSPSTKSTKSTSSPASEKENMSRRPHSHQVPTRSSSKWSKVSAINKGFMASGLRSLFR